MELSHAERRVMHSLVLVSIILTATAMYSNHWLVSDSYSNGGLYGLRDYDRWSMGYDEGLPHGFETWRAIGTLTLVAGIVALITLVLGVISKDLRIWAAKLSRLLFVGSLVGALDFALDPPSGVVNQVGPCFPAFLAGALAGVIASAMLVPHTIAAVTPPPPPPPPPPEPPPEPPAP